MKHVDIKKLKVTELRTRLKELGLDSRGLKAELVDRLWSALKPEENGEQTEENIQNDSSPTASTLTGKVEVCAPSLSPTEAGVTAPCKPDCAREFTDIATQTESGVTTTRSGSEPVSVSVMGTQAEGGAEARPGEDSGALSSEEMGKGRAFFEFKEEIRYKR